MAIVLAVVGAYGVFLIYTAGAFGWSGVGVGPAAGRRVVGRGDRLGQWLAQAGLEDVRPREFAAVMAALFVVGLAVAFALFGGLLPGLVATAAAASSAADTAATPGPG